jgi:choline dehydrogenase-like flavoprotein
MQIETFDYVIVGAGSAGCVLANRLTEDGKSTVLLLEYGGADGSVYIQMPSALSIPMNMDRYNWGYETEPEPHLGGRRLHTPRGKVLGGSSSINGMVYIRGNPLDFERWEEEGAALTNPLIFVDAGIARIWSRSVESAPRRGMDAERGQGRAFEWAFGRDPWLHWRAVWA